MLNPYTSYTARLANGGLNGQFHPVKDASVSLNGAQIFGPADFRHTVGVLTKPVTL